MKASLDTTYPSDIKAKNECVLISSKYLPLLILKDA